MVPSGWVATQVGDIAKFASGSTPSKQNPDFWGGFEPWISGKDLKTHYLSSSIDTLTSAGFQVAKKAPKGATLILVRGMTLLKDFPVGFAMRDVAFNQDLKALVPSKRVDGLFLSFLLVAEKHKIRQLVSIAGHGTGRLDTHSIQEYPVNLPPLTEQKKIAKVLSSWDKAIATTEQLLANSHQQKKALMQKLLTGKKRIIKNSNYIYSVREGFAKSKLGSLPDDWKVELINKHLWYQEGPGVRKTQFTASGIKLLNGTNIQFNKINLNNTATYISEEECSGVYKHFLIDGGDLLIACSGISVDRFDEKIAFVLNKDLPLCMNTSTMRFKPLCNGGVDIEYFQYFMQSSVFKNQIRRQATGSAQLNFGPTHIGKCFVVVPSLEEQKKIASVLSTADQKITVLEDKLDALKQEKRALMQQLLKGKRRVNVEAA